MGTGQEGQRSLPCGSHPEGMEMQTHSSVQEGWQGGDPHMSLPAPLAGSFPHAPFTCISRFSQHSSSLEIVSFRCQGDLAGRILLIHLVNTNNPINTHRTNCKAQWGFLQAQNVQNWGAYLAVAAVLIFHVHSFSSSL